MAYAFPVDVERIAQVIEENITPAGRKKASFLIVQDDIAAGKFTVNTFFFLKNCGRKVTKAVDLDILYQSFEYSAKQKANS